jgi:hypothetical protein
VKDFICGLAAAFVGLVALVYCSLFADGAAWVGAPRQWGGYAGNAVGFLLLIGGPLYFWMLRPLRRRRRKT